MLGILCLDGIGFVVGGGRLLVKVGGMVDMVVARLGLDLEGGGVRLVVGVETHGD